MFPVNGIHDAGRSFKISRLGQLIDLIQFYFILGFIQLISPLAPFGFEKNFDCRNSILIHNYKIV